MNSVNLVGRLTRDPEVRMTQSGQDVANFSLAVDRAGDRNDEGGYDAGFFDCTAWGKTATLIAEYFHKGKQIGVTGRLLHHRWESRDGEKRSKVQITVTDITFVGSKSDDQREDDDGQQRVPSGQQRVPSGASRTSDEADFGGSDDDIPF